jgi:hypothetical protein
MELRPIVRIQLHNRQMKPDPCLTGNSRNAKALCRIKGLYKIFQHWNHPNSMDAMESMEAMQRLVWVHCMHLYFS